MSGAKVGYARVSTGEQNLSLQLDALETEGCTRVFKETASGAKSVRKGLADAVASCAAGDVLTVWKLDRLGRSLSDLVALAELLKSRDVGLKLLTGAGAAIDTTKPEGRLMFGVMAVFAEFERELIRERTKAGMVAARRRGKHVGRPCAMTDDQTDAAAHLIAGGRSAREIAKAFGVSPHTVRSSLKRRLAKLQRRVDRGGGPQSDLETYIAGLDQPVASVVSSGQS